MNAELRKLMQMAQPKQSRYIRMRDEILCLAMSANTKGLRFLQIRYADIMSLYQEGVGSMSDTSLDTSLVSDDEVFPPIPHDLDIDLPVDLPRSGESGPTKTVDLTPYAGIKLELKYKDDTINTNADELWALLRGIVEDCRNFAPTRYN